ncbi:MAG: alkaline phosphatase [Lentimonas sp.]
MPDTPKQSSRRQFLKGAGLVSAATALTACSSIAKPTASGSGASAKKAKNLIFLVVDGMCLGTLALAHHWNLRNRKAPLNWMQLYGREGVTRVMQDTASASSPVTDSAAASSSWGCGQRVNNGSINYSVDGKALTPLFSYAKAAGKATGLVTSCTVTHATPAGFSANVKQRGQEKDIAQQYLDRGIDVILGGGSSNFVYKASTDKGVTRPAANLIPDFKAKGYQVIRDRKALTAAKGQSKLLGLFSAGHIPFAIDRKNDASLKGVPSLLEMFSAALASLSASKDGFVLQVEGGRVDHAGHANDPAAILHEQLEFDACIPIALEFIEKHPDTLLIVTTDHGTGGCQLNGKGSAYVESGPALDDINDFKYSFEWLQGRFKKSGRFSAKDFKRATGIEPNALQVSKIQKGIDDKTKYLSSMMTGVVQDELFSKTAVGWTSNNHTSECVELFAFGPGSTEVPAFVKNYKMNGVMRNALGLD